MRLINNRRGGSTALLTVLLVLLAGCQADGNSASSHRAQRAASAPRVEGDRAAEYTSLTELAKDSTAVVIAASDSQQSSLVHGVPFMTTTMTVQQTISGSVPGTFRLYQIGANDGSAPPDMVVADAGRTYLLFITPYETAPGVAVAPDLFTTVGAAAGMYQQGSSGFDKIDPASPLLPATVTAASAKTAFSVTH